MAAKKNSIITESHKIEILKSYNKNKKFNRTNLALSLGIPPLTVINYLNKYLVNDNGGMVNTDICPITGYHIKSKICRVTK